MRKQMVKKILLLIVSLCSTCVVSAQAMSERDHIRKGYKLYTDSLFEKAEVEYRKALELNPASTDALYNLGNALYNQAVTTPAKGEEALAQYSTAAKLETDKSRLAQIYHNIANEFNNNDKTAYKLYNEMHKKYEDYTAVLYKEAETNYNQHRYTQATDFYQKYIDFHGNNKEMATSRLIDIKRNIQNKRVMPHVLYYQFDSNAPIGFGYGRFNDRKVGWFMNFSMNNEVFKLINENWEPKDAKGGIIKTIDGSGSVVKRVDVVNEVSNVPEINLALVGLSIPLVSPHPEKENQYFKLGKLVVPKFPALYLNIVPLSASLSFGYDNTKLYKKDDNGDKVYWENNKHLDNNIENYKLKEYNTNPLFCYAPQVGLTLKWGRLALFYTFEYRYLVNERNTYKDAIRDNRNMFGLGFAW
jgi:tetratricopeptide (TPR) repeat protein